MDTHFEISMDNSLGVHVVDSLENLLDQLGGVSLRVAALFDYPIEELAAIYTDCYCSFAIAQQLFC